MTVPSLAFWHGGRDQPLGKFRIHDFPDDDGRPEKALADDFYQGIFCFAGETTVCAPQDLFAARMGSCTWRTQRDSLDWLKHFLARPKRLHCHFVARLLAAWMSSEVIALDLCAEAHRLINLSRVLPRLAALTNDNDQKNFAEALAFQCKRLRRMRSCTSLESLMQAQALLVAAACYDGLGNYLQPALQQFERSLPSLLHDDGGPCSGRLSDLIAISHGLETVSRLDGAVCDSNTIVSVRDRVRAFLAMLQVGANGQSRHLPEALAASPPNFLAGAMPLSHAPRSGFTRLAQGETLVIARWGVTLGASTIEAFYNGQPLFTLTHGLVTDDMPHASADRLIQTGLGEALAASWQSGKALQETVCYLAAAGTDIRHEARYNGPELMPVMVLQFAERARLFVVKGGQEATLLQPDGGSWLIRLRGGQFQPGPQSGALHVVALVGGPGTVSWAIRKQSSTKKRPRNPAGGHSNAAELPFSAQ
jgi:hypothetical protein